ncbi:hypothetical protein CASFOL_002129 [Castilleja foliolosa]|uniref:PFU domain-containing protein n=1 Tax=Castilleja foliolosa TaxID=1961234 RepID=A0ABD3EDE6_9LAMI
MNISARCQYREQQLELYNSLQIVYAVLFEVDIGYGEPVRNSHTIVQENPYDLADKWLLKENLHLSYRQQVVQFILQNSGQRDFLRDPMFRDPYTGASAYIPGAPSRMPSLLLFLFLSFLIKDKITKIIGFMLVFDVAQFDGILLPDPDKSYLSLNEGDVSILDVMRMFVLNPDGKGKLLQHVKGEMV